MKFYALPDEARSEEEILLGLGLSPKLLGYDYIAYALKLIKADPTYLRAITKRLYVDVGNHFDARPYNVERDIRHAINNIFTHGDFEYISSMFVNSVQPLKGSPTNGEFLALLNLRSQQICS